VIDWDPTAREPTGRGCSAADYTDLPARAIVLVRPGPCIRRDAIIAAQAAGAAAFVAGYPSADSGKVLRPTLLEPTGIEIPAIAATRPAAEALAGAGASGASVRLVADARIGSAPTRSIIAELPGSEPDTVVMLGAHLDSVIDGPGINDNGSGVAALLEIARALRESHPRATIRLAFWSDEETGLHGSSHYVNGLSTTDRDALLVYLNADMLASPNGFAGVYEEAPATGGAETVSDLIAAAVGRAGGVAVRVPGGASDHLRFDQAGIPIGGVFSGANEILTAEQAVASGATAGSPADPCYHQACDDGSKVNLRLARILATALADVAVGLSNDPTLPPGS
jgi:aminopeptidase Y